MSKFWLFVPNKKLDQIYSKGILYEGCTLELNLEIGLMLLFQPCSLRAKRRSLYPCILSALDANVDYAAYAKVP